VAQKEEVKRIRPTREERW